MASPESFLKDISDFLARLPRTYVRLGFTPWKVGSLLSKERSRAVGPLPFLLVSSFMFTLIWNYWGIFGMDLEGAATRLQASAKSGFDVLNLLLDCAPVFFAAVLTAVVISRGFAFLFATQASRSIVAEESCDVMWYSTGFQILTVSLWIAIPELIYVAWEGLAGWTHLWHPDTRNPEYNPLFNTAVLIYLALIPFLLAAGYVYHRYKFPQSQPRGTRKWLRPIVAALIMGLASVVTTGMGLVTLATVQEIGEQHQPTVKSPVTLFQVPLPGGHTTQVISRPDSSLEIHLAAVLHNGSNHPILLQRNLGRLHADTAPNLAPAILDPFPDTTGVVVISPNSVRWIPITLLCTKVCLTRIRRSDSFTNLRIHYRSPGSDGSWNSSESRPEGMDLSDSVTQQIIMGRNSQ